MSSYSTGRHFGGGMGNYGVHFSPVVDMIVVAVVEVFVTGVFVVVEVVEVIVS